MGGLFSKPKTQKAPKLTPEAPLPEITSDTGDEEMKRIRRRSNRSKTVITGALEPMYGGGKNLLG